ncbi:histidine phosphatase family protein [Microbacteriaceae bacterium VKM Ac-2854]|nr:histidine phosphatase family protein [Microbacteriaceae bacterium VKM Ac-2854]
MRLILIRHGQTPSNVDGLLDTRIPGPGLTELGLEQAAAVPAVLEGERIDAIAVSNMVRTHLTAAPLVAERGLVPVERAGVREITSGDLEMKSDEESVRLYMGTVFRWAEGELDVRMPGGESGAEFFERYDAVIAELAAAGHESVVVVSHGAAIRCWTGLRGANLDAEFIAEHAIDNTGVVVLEGSGTDWTVLTWAGEPVGGIGVAAPSGPSAETSRA